MVWHFAGNQFSVSRLWYSSMLEADYDCMNADRPAKEIPLEKEKKKYRQTLSVM